MKERQEDFLQRNCPTQAKTGLEGATRPTQGRWISPDRAGLAAVDSANPQSWNRYAYVENNPLSNADPSGQCTIFVAGVNDKVTTPGFGAAAAQVGGVVVAPFEGESTLGAIINVAAQALVGPNASTEEVANAVNAIQNDPNGIQVVAFSGGAQTFSTAIQSGLIQSGGKCGDRKL